MKNITKALGLLTIPIFLTLGAYILMHNVSELSKSWISVLQYSPYILIIIGFILGSRFNKSRVFFLCLVLSMNLLILSNQSYFLDSIYLALPQIFGALSILLPINVLVFSILKERGILTLWGKFRLVFIFSQVIFIWWITQSNNSDIQSYIYYTLVNPNYIRFMHMPQISILLFTLTFAFLGTRLILKPTLMDSSLMGVLFTSFSGFAFKDEFLALEIFLGVSGLILIFSIIESTYFMAYLDELTGIPARRALKESMMKLGGKYTIAMTDIDFFKKFNDTYGHDTGDEVLKLVASGLQQVRGGGKAFRYGGEEFTILFPNKTSSEVISYLEELRENISKQRYTYKKKRKVQGKYKVTSKELSVTISIGVAEKSDKYKSAEEVMKAADNALYRAKKKGRNCVCK